MSKTNVSLLLLFVVFFAGATSARANESIMRSAAIQQPTPPEPQRKQERKKQALYPPRRRICCFNDMKPACGAFAEDEGWAAEDPTEFQWIADDYDLDHDDWEDDGESVPAWFEAAYDACTRIWITGEARELPSACAGAAARCLFAAMMTMLLVVEDTLQSSRIRLTWRDRAADAAGMIFMTTCATGILLVGLSALLSALTFMALILCSDILHGRMLMRTGI